MFLSCGLLADYKHGCGIAECPGTFRESSPGSWHRLASMWRAVNSINFKFVPFLEEVEGGFIGCGCLYEVEDVLIDAGEQKLQLFSVGFGET